MISDAVSYRKVNIEGYLPKDFLGWLLMIFIVGCMTLFENSQFILIGIILVGTYTLYFLKGKKSLPVEIVILFVWILWATTGFFVSVNSDAFIKELKLMTQIALMSFAVAGITSKIGSLRINFIALVLGGLVLLILSATQEEFLMAIESSEKIRFGGLTHNSNLLGWNLIVCMIATLYFLGLSRTWKYKIMNLIIIICLIVGIILSGSRKMFIGIVTLLLTWWSISYYKKAYKNLFYFIPMCLLLIGLFYVSEYMFENTYMGERFKKDFVEDPITERHERHMRVNLYIEGFEIIKKNLLFGVGLGNFRFYSSDDHNPHTDYIEIMACGGIIGFILYFSIYSIVWIRLTRIRAIANDFEIIYTAGVLKAALITMLIVGFARPHSGSQTSWILLSSAIGYSWSIESKMKSCRAPSHNMLGRDRIIT